MNLNFQGLLSVCRSLMTKKAQSDEIYAVPFNGTTLYIGFQADPWKWTVHLPGCPPVSNPDLSMAILLVSRGWTAAGRPSAKAIPIRSKGAVEVTIEDVLFWAGESEGDRIQSLFAGHTEGFRKLKAQANHLVLSASDQVRAYPYDPNVAYAHRDTTPILEVRFGVDRSEFGVISVTVYLDGTFRIGGSAAITNHHVISQLEAVGRALEFIQTYELVEQPRT